ncbi:MAG: hypothetical protein K2O16_14715 [Lachnospiraceae bacterium]|nr:hypothetical protein [Lachnospiraceae bacterium]
MKNAHFETETDGFCGACWKCKNKSDAAMILMLGDDSCRKNRQCIREGLK